MAGGLAPEGSGWGPLGPADRARPHAGRSRPRAYAMSTARSAGALDRQRFASARMSGLLPLRIRGRERGRAPCGAVYARQAVLRAGERACDSRGRVGRASARFLASTAGRDSSERSGSQSCSMGSLDRGRGARGALHGRERLCLSDRAASESLHRCSGDHRAAARSSPTDLSIPAFGASGSVPPVLRLGSWVSVATSARGPSCIRPLGRRPVERATPRAALARHAQGSSTLGRAARALEQGIRGRDAHRGRLVTPAMVSVATCWCCRQAPAASGLVRRHVAGEERIGGVSRRPATWSRRSLLLGSS